ncbi:unnamed protein product [Amoebophrya sp. A25]|nr:unnamed protein product [Amoebophrya sp. A25]|eukprot:GSA25T00024055001.1
MKDIYDTIISNIVKIYLFRISYTADGGPVQLRNGLANCSFGHGGH